MAFTVKDWKDSPDTTTPITAAALEDLETRVTDYSTPRVLSPGNLTAAYALDLDNDAHVWVRGTLNANCTITVTNIAAGSVTHLFLTQDATGGRTLSITGASDTESVPVNTDASATTHVTLWAISSTDVLIETS